MKQKINGANVPHLQPMAKLHRNQRSEIGRQHVKAQCCSHFSPCFDHTSPTQTNDGTSQMDHDIRDCPLLFSNNVMRRFFLVPFQLEYKDEGDKVNGLKSPPSCRISN